MLVPFQLNITSLVIDLPEEEDAINPVRDQRSYGVYMID